MPTILLKKSDTPGSVPGTANLTNLAGGVEVAVNTADKRMFSMTSASAVIELGTNPSSLTCADASFTVARVGSLTISSLSLTNATFASATITNLTSTSATISSALTLSGGTANGVLYLNGSKVATSGSAFVFDGTNVGIGTSSPAVPLDVVSNSGSNGINIRARSSNDYGFLNFKSNDGSDTAGSIAALRAGVNSGSLLFYTGTTEKARLDTSGNLGIGTSSPAAKLSVDSGSSALNANFNSTNASGIYVRFQNSGTSIGDIGGGGSVVSGGTAGDFAIASRSGNLVLGTGSVTRATLDSSGNLGIGTSSPAYKLDVSGTNDQYIRVTTTTSGGYAAGLRMNSTGSREYGIFADGSLRFYDFTASATRVTLDSSGNLGLGVTPSAWSSSVAAQVGYGAALSSRSAGNTASDMTHGAYWNGTNWLYQHSSVGAGRYQMTGANAGSTHAWFVSAGGTAGNTISFTQAMTLDANGYLGIGTTNPSASAARLVVSKASGVIASFTNDVDADFQISTASTATTIGCSTSTPLIFKTGNTERARITSGGDLLVGTTTSSGKTTVVYSSTSSFGISVENQVASPGVDGSAVFANLSSATGTNAGTAYLYRGRSAGADRFYVYGNGGVGNYQSNNVDLSDVRTKKDINPIASMWDKIGALEIVTYKYNDQTHDDVNVGVIAQQVEAVEPVWVDSDGFGETPEGEEPLKTVYTKDITFAAIKALQEAMARIEQLEAKVAALEAK